MSSFDWGCCRFGARAGDGVVFADDSGSAVYGPRWGSGGPLWLVEENVGGGRVGKKCVFHVAHVGAVNRQCSSELKRVDEDTSVAVTPGLFGERMGLLAQRL